MSLAISITPQAYTFAFCDQTVVVPLDATIEARTRMTHLITRENAQSIADCIRAFLVGAHYDAYDETRADIRPYYVMEFCLVREMLACYRVVLDEVARESRARLAVVVHVSRMIACYEADRSRMDADAAADYDRVLLPAVNALHEHMRKLTGGVPLAHLLERARIGRI